MIWSLATEDALSEAVGIRLLQEQGASPYQCLRRDGSGYLYSKRANWKNLARLYPVLVLTDLDRLECAVALKRGWYGEESLPQSLFFRVAVREVEAWLLADHSAIMALFGKRFKNLPAPEGNLDPKLHLLQQAKKAPRDIRDDVVREEHGILKQGLGYNARLCDFVCTLWSPERAARRAPSLAKARLRLAEFAGRDRE